jgi:hypothetical protein
MFRFFLLILFLLSLYPEVCGQEVYNDALSGVEIFFPAGRSDFPHQWLYKKVNAEIQPLCRDEESRVEDILSRAFSKYPAELLRTCLDKVYVIKTMKFYGLPYGGTNYRHSVYLADDFSDPYFTDSYIEQVFHHEFSSVLIRYFNAFFAHQKWVSVNPPSFRYGNGGADAIRKGQASMDLDPDLIEQGFLSQYSTASLEEDVNVFAQFLFTGGREFWRLVDLNDNIREKTRILISFYHQLDPVFTESYFRSLYYNTAQRQAIGIRH